MRGFFILDTLNLVLEKKRESSKFRENVHFKCQKFIAMKSLCVVFFCVLLLTSCNINKTLTCEDWPIDIEFSGFDSTEVSKLEYRTFVANGRFDSLLVSSTFDLAQSYSYRFTNKIAVLDQAVRDENRDLEILFPASGRRYRISNLVREPVHQETIKDQLFCKVDHICTNGFLSYSLDGTTVSIPSYHKNLVITK